MSSGDFAKKAGIDPRNYSSIESGKRSLGDRVLRDICSAFPINFDWVMTGEGEMLKNISNKEANKLDYNNEQYNIPLLPISAQGGSFNDFVASIRESDCERIMSPIKGAELAMPISGDSMSPEYPSGSQVLLKRINERAFIDWGRVYVLDTCNGSVIKKLFPSETENCVRCVSINPLYPPFDVCMEDIYGVYRVLMCMSLK